MPVNHLEHVYKSKTGTYTARLRVPADVQPIIKKTELHQSLRTKSKTEAAALAPTIIRQLQNEIELARSIPSKTLGGTSLLDAADHLPNPHYRLVLRDLANHSGCDQIEQLTYEAWQRWCYHREDLVPKRSVYTLRNEVTLVRTAILKTMAARRLPFDQQILATPKWRPPTRDERRARQQANSPYTLARWQQLYDAMDRNTPIQRASCAIFALGLFTGARISEISNMQADHVTDGLWSIPRSKNLAGERVIPLIPLAQHIIASQPVHLDGYIFPRINLDWKTQANRFSARVNHYLTRAGALAFETMHSTRSTFRTLVPRCAPSPEGTVDMLMGHSPSGHVSATYYRATLEDCIQLMSHYRPEVRVD